MYQGVLDGVRPDGVVRNRLKSRRRLMSLWAAGMAVSLLPFLLTGSVWFLILPVLVFAGFHPWMNRPGGVAVLTYHSVAPLADWLPWSGDISITPPTLDAQLAALNRVGCNFVSTRQLVAARRLGDDLPERPVVVHFDDGYLDNFVFAAPILRRHGAYATFFVSTEFIEPGDRTGADGRVEGYMTWEEIRQLAADPLFEVHPHGIDHGRVPVSKKQVDTLTEDNWRQHAWMTWARIEGSKHDWFRRSRPPMPYGTPVPESRPALAAQALGESPEDYTARITDHLRRAREEVKEKTGSDADIFCWPQNACSEEGRAIAASLGYIATTGGKGENRVGEPGDVISRVHAGARLLGFRWLAFDGVFAVASARSMQGNHYWSLFLAMTGLVRAPIRILRRIFQYKPV